ncbi:hypothetical protein C162_03784 [Paenibacillus sp. FSL R7-269]|nr:hypothetical protein C162_03784 [Paenibacillus sp. FSL R7-269]
MLSSIKIKPINIGGIELVDRNNKDDSYHFIKEENQRAKQNNIRWFRETVHFETLREAEEWVYNGDAFNKIGVEFEGYVTSDPKLAFALLFNLTRENTLNQRFQNIFADEDHSDGQALYMVWVS